EEVRAASRVEEREDSRGPAERSSAADLRAVRRLGSCEVLAPRRARLEAHERARALLRQWLHADAGARPVLHGPSSNLLVRRTQARQDRAWRKTARLPDVASPLRRARDVQARALPGGGAGSDGDERLGAGARARRLLQRRAPAAEGRRPLTGSGTHLVVLGPRWRPQP